MADEIQILTTSADGSTWVDVVPNAVSTGYQAQNTNIDAIRNGEDRSSITYDSGSAEIVLSPSGVIDVNGLPFVIKTETRLPISTDGDYYIKIIAGTGSTLRSAELSSSRGTWDASKNAFYDSGLRVLNWLINKTGDDVTIYRLVGENQQAGENQIPQNPYGLIRRGDLPYWMYWGVLYQEFSAPAGVVRGVTVDAVNGNLITCTETTISIHDGISSSVLTSFSSPAGCQDVAYIPSTENLVSCSNTANLIYIHNGISASILSSFASPASDITGIDFSGQFVSCDRGTKLIYIHTGVTATISSSFAAQDGAVTGVGRDGNFRNVLSCGSNNKHYIHAGDTAGILMSFEAIAAGEGITYYNKQIITVSATTSKVYVFGFPA